jgi:creatinine amidohydrolase
LIPDGKQAKFPAYDVYPIKEDWVPETGVLRTAKIASTEFGEKLFKEYSETIARAIKAEF